MFDYRRGQDFLRVGIFMQTKQVSHSNPTQRGFPPDLTTAKRHLEFQTLERKSDHWVTPKRPRMMWTY